MTSQPIHAKQEEREAVFSESFARTTGGMPSRSPVQVPLATGHWPCARIWWALLGRLEIRSLLDAPCGDFHWMKALDLGIARYIGMDIVQELVARNRRIFGAPNVSFVAGDIIADALPQVDSDPVPGCARTFSERGGTVRRSELPSFRLHLVVDDALLGAIA